MAISITPLSGGNTPADGSDPRTFPAIWNATASDLEGVAADLDTLEASALTPANVTTPSDGELLAYDSAESEWVNQALTAAQLPTGSILQVVRASDASARSTTSTSYVDVTGLSVTITPTSATSAVLLVATVLSEIERTSNSSSAQADFIITDSSDNAISGTERVRIVRRWEGNATVQDVQLQTMIAYATPATTSATTYKVRHKASTAADISNVAGNLNTSQLYAIEVAA